MMSVTKAGAPMAQQTLALNLCVKGMRCLASQYASIEKPLRDLGLRVGSGPCTHHGPAGFCLNAEIIAQSLTRGSALARNGLIAISYESGELKAALSDSGLELQDLGDMLRSTQADQAINNLRCLQRFTRESLSNERENESCRLLRIKSLEALGRRYPLSVHDETPSWKGAAHGAISRSLEAVGCGRLSVSETKREILGLYSCVDKDVFGFALGIRVTDSPRDFPVLIQVYLVPYLNESLLRIGAGELSSLFCSSLMHPLWVLVDGLGFYMASGNADQFAGSVYVAKEFLNKVVLTLRECALGKV